MSSNSQEADQPAASATELVNAFLASATAEFAPFVREASDRWEVRVEQATPEGLVDVSPERFTGFFLASASFANARVEGRLTFGDRELSVNAVVGPAGRPARYGLWEWADALGRRDLVPRNADFVLTVPRLERMVADMAVGLRALEGEIAAAPPTIAALMDHARAEVQERFRQVSRRDDHRRASAAAAEAFRIRDYRRVIELLESVEELLTDAERVKLAYARQHLG